MAINILWDSLIQYVPLTTGYPLEDAVKQDLITLAQSKKHYQLSTNDSPHFIYLPPHQMGLGQKPLIATLLMANIRELTVELNEPNTTHAVAQRALIMDMYCTPNTDYTNFEHTAIQRVARYGFYFYADILDLYSRAIMI